MVQTQHSTSSRRLAATGFSYDPKGFSGQDVETDLRDGLNHTRSRRVLDHQIFHTQQRS
ncbi:hypothetical protein [Rhodococcus qingshengii]|uniref:hypothetical protein n=1 Tax=Rhodococcus qingshengii TaxID=334542 RepID=UPI0027E39EEB|nr:hypothetical protein [Rhodococcus qingshengii]